MSKVRPTNRRTRTGCLTCRMRRIKCDERKPTCERCEVSNIHCTGYQEKRPVEIWKLSQYHQRTATQSSHCPSSTQQQYLTSTTALPTPTLGVEFPQLRFREDGLPLVGLPSNPSSQLPCAAARVVLAYNQYLFRTVALLFPSEHMCFWRDRLCEDAWGTEYVFQTIIALGSMHRAVLELSMPGDSDQLQGIDTKVIATQAYVQALKLLSGQLEEAKRNTEVLAATMLLMAYFEIFAGNVTAAYGHVHTASHYVSDIRLDLGSRVSSTCSSLVQSAIIPIEAALQNLCHMFRTLLPFSGTVLLSPRQSFTPLPPGHLASTNHGALGTFPPLRQLLGLVVADSDVEDLIWSPMPLWRHPIQPEKIHKLRKLLCEWGENNRSSMPEPSLPTAEAYPFSVGELAVPPSPSSAAPASAAVCFVGAVYNFYLGRTMWALALLESDSTHAQTHEQSAYCFFYEALTLIAALAGSYTTSPASIDTHARYLPCEALTVGLLPMLNLIGQCLPQRSWLSWVTQVMKQIGREGLFDGHVFATSLEFLHTFEEGNMPDPLTDEYSSPRSRTVGILVPETTGRGYTSYYARPLGGTCGSPMMNGAAILTYYPIGHVSWSMDAEIVSSPVSVFDDIMDMATPFTADFLRHRPAVSEWIYWSGGVEFNLDRVLRDHMNGSQLSFL